MSGLLKNIAAKIAAIWRVFIKVLKAFFEIKDRDSTSSKTKKVAVTAARRTIYIIADYWTAILCFSLVGAMKFYGFNDIEIFLGTWAYDFIVASAFLVVSLKSGQDITLGEAFRRAADVIHSSNKIAGYATFGYLTLKATIWDGPEQIAIFFKKEIKTLPRMIWLLFFLTMVQGGFYAWAYSLGYDSVSELIKHIF